MQRSGDEMSQPPRIPQLKLNRKYNACGSTKVDFALHPAKGLQRASKGPPRAVSRRFEGGFQGLWGRFLPEEGSLSTLVGQQSGFRVPEVGSGHAR